MRIKISPKSALVMIDDAIRRGHGAYLGTERSMFAPDYKIDDWFDKVAIVLKEIFVDYAPVYKFLKCSRKFVDNPFDRLPKDESEKALDVLLTYYDYFVSLQKSPARYFPEKAEIWLYDLCCNLEPESNESELCKYMFQFGIGEFREVSEIHKHITGEEYDSKAKDKNVVFNALDGVNRKTNEVFKFPLFEKRKSVVALSIPSRLVLDLS